MILHSPLVIHGGYINMKKRIIFATLFLGIMFSLSVGIGAAGVSTSWGPSNEDGAIFEWTINELEDENGSTSWTWDLLGHTFTEGDKITFEWTSFNDTLIEIDSDSPSLGVPFENYSSAAIKVGTTTMDENQTIAMRMLILPVYVWFGGGDFSGFGAMEGYWWNSYIFPNAVDTAGADWNLDLISDTAEMEVIGKDAAENATVDGYIFNVDYPYLLNGTMDPNYIGKQNIQTFDVSYDAANGHMTSLQFPCTIAQNVGSDPTYPGPYPAVGNNVTYLSENLAKLDITLTSAPEAANWPSGAPGFELIIALGSFATIALVISRKRK